MDNVAIARLLGEIADLLEIRADNPFKIRAYRNAADTVTAEPSRVAVLDDAALRALPGIGKDLAARIREIVETGDTPYRQELAAAFPATMLDLLRLQGVGPKTVKRLYDELGVTSLDTLEAAAKDGRIRASRAWACRRKHSFSARSRNGAGTLDGTFRRPSRTSRVRWWRAERRRPPPTSWPSAACGAAPRRAATSTSWLSARRLT